MRILVTGGTGFLGGHLARHLLRQGHRVTIFGRSATAADPLAALGAEVVLGDLAEEHAVFKAVAGHDAIMHCGALSALWGDDRQFYRANVLGTRNVVASALRAGMPRLVHVSTPSIYVGGANLMQIPEDMPLPRHSINRYAATKRLAEGEVLQGVMQGLPAIMLRPQAIFGAGDTAIIPRLIRTNQEVGIPLFGDGNHLIDLTYVDNLVGLMASCLDIPLKSAAASATNPWAGRVYNVTNGEPVAFAGFLQEVFHKLGIEVRFRRLPLALVKAATRVVEGAYRTLRLREEPPITRYSLSVLSQGRTLSIERARLELGYKPQVSVAQGVEHFVSWWLQQGGSH